MSRGRTLVLGTWSLGLVLGVGLGTATGQQSTPTENKGVSVGKTTVVDLGPEIAGMQGRQLRMRVITVDPGGHIRQHNHNDWPGVVYVLQGVATEYRGGGANEYRTGDMFTENKDTTHWFENKGTTPFILLVVDVFKQPSEPHPNGCSEGTLATRVRFATARVRA
jgi:quercetin dioxygenase-like cupin family protein